MIKRQFINMIVQLISEVARPSFFSEEVSKEYFILLSNLILRSPQIFASEVGAEYLNVFACSQINILTSAQSGKQYFEKTVKRTLLSLKKRDEIDQHKRSFFYCLMLKTILTLA